MTLTRQLGRYELLEQLAKGGMGAGGPCRDGLCATWGRCFICAGRAEAPLTAGVSVLLSFC